MNPLVDLVELWLLGAKALVKFVAVVGAGVIAYFAIASVVGSLFSRDYRHPKSKK